MTPEQIAEMLALLTSIADSLAKLANPPMVVGTDGIVREARSSTARTGRQAVAPR